MADERDEQRRDATSQHSAVRISFASSPLGR